jgi:hypothetical protein
MFRCAHAIAAAIIRGTGPENAAMSTARVPAGSFRRVNPEGEQSSDRRDAVRADHPAAHEQFVVVREATEAFSITCPHRRRPIHDESDIEIGDGCTVDRISVERRLRPLSEECLLLQG